jgi:hypothetical protein
MTKKWFSTGSGRIEFELRLSDAHYGHHQGQCDDDIADLRKVPYISAILASINADLLRDELREYGAWDADELADHDANLNRILWIACGDICEAETMGAE